MTDERVLVVYGMSSEASDNWGLLRRSCIAVMPQARILLLSDNIWLHVPASLQVCGVMAQAPKSASIERLRQPSSTCWPRERHAAAGTLLGSPAAVASAWDHARDGGSAE